MPLKLRLIFWNPGRNPGHSIKNQELVVRFLIVMIIIILVVFKLWPDQTPSSVEETFIGPQLVPLKKAEQVEQQYQEALDRANEKIERESDGG